MAKHKFVIDETGMFDQNTELTLWADEPVEKFNQCHGASGKFCSSGGGSGGSGGAVDLPPEMMAVNIGEVEAPKEPAVEIPGWQGSLEAEEIQAVKDYSGNSYGPINRHLRENSVESAVTKPILDKKVQNIDSAIDKAPRLKGEEIVYRGMQDCPVMQNLVKGQVIQDPGFMSTSFDRNVAGNFGSHLWNIRVPSGMKGLRMQDLFDNEQTKHERELLLPRGTKLLVTRVSQKGGWLSGVSKHTVVDARVVPADVTKSEDEVEKFNQCHGESGKFCSSGGSGGGAGGSEDWKGSLTADEMQSLKEYTGPSYAPLNRYLRDRESTTDPILERKARNMDSAIAKTPTLKGEEIVYRGMRDCSVMEHLEKGQIVQDPGFMSTSRDRNIAGGFGSHLWNIRVPAGAHALRMNDLFVGKQTENEKELLLPRKTKLLITHVRQTGGGTSGFGTHTVVDARVVL